jgi:hypothetical protein
MIRFTLKSVAFVVGIVVLVIASYMLAEHRGPDHLVIDRWARELADRLEAARVPPEITGGEGAT